MENKDQEQHALSRRISAYRFEPVDKDRLTEKIMDNIQSSGEPVSTERARIFGWLQLGRVSFAVISMVLIVTFLQEVNNPPFQVPQSSRNGEKSVILNSSAYMPLVDDNGEINYSEFFRQRVLAKKERQQFWSKIKKKYEQDD